MLDPDFLDLGPDPHTNDGPSGRDWLWILLPVVGSYALAFGVGYWVGGW